MPFSRLGKQQEGGFGALQLQRPGIVTREAAPGLDPFVLMALGPALSVLP